MSEIENNVPVIHNAGAEPEGGSKVLNEEYFKEQFLRIQGMFDQKDTIAWQQFLLKNSQNMKTLLTRLELPWDKYIPILHYCFMLYIQGLEGRESRKQAARLSMDLMACMACLARSGRLINRMADFYNQQIADLEKLIAAGGSDDH